MSNTTRTLVVRGKSMISMIAMALVVASFSMFAVPQKASAHTLPNCNPSTQRCSPTIMECEVYRPFLYWGVANQRGCVAALQGFLHEYGAYYRGAIDGLFGSITYEAVREFQDPGTIAVDGQVGNDTWTRIDLTCSLSPSPAVADTCNSRFEY